MKKSFVRMAIWAITWLVMSQLLPFSCKEKAIDKGWKVTEDGGIEIYKDGVQLTGSMFPEPNEPTQFGQRIHWDEDGTTVTIMGYTFAKEEPNEP